MDTSPLNVTVTSRPNHRLILWSAIPSADSYQILRGFKANGTDLQVVATVLKPTPAPGTPYAYENWVDFFPRSAILFYKVQAFNGAAPILPGSDLCSDLGFPNLGDGIGEPFLSSIARFDMDNFDSQGKGFSQ